MCMARESFFDGRYRYDHIYPRGRSGEALRAYDTEDNDRLVVIKRPAPQDAPPIRAGQEVNIRSERRALMQLSGHSVLTELLGEGTFSVGGQTHLYIVMERAVGAILEEEVLELAKSNARLPELEMLVIVDALLDLLEAAHNHEIVYNDVDAKHLFWDRDAYQLKVIDWGNAVFLEGDEVTPQGVSRQSDIFQIGELLYFVFTGGQRLSQNGETIDFGEDANRVSTRLQHIIQRAVHPILDRRYLDVATLRDDLTEYRRPLERDRENALDRIERRLQKQCSQQELERLLEDVITVQLRDPGYPRVCALRQRIEAELHRLSVLSDLDAVRIYLDSANWVRAITVLEDVVGRADGEELRQARLLLEAAQMVEENKLSPPPAGVLPAIDALFAGDPRKAAHVLQVMPESRAPARSLQWLLAERIQVHIPYVIVLRPHLLRLRIDLDQLKLRYPLQAAVEHVVDSWAVLRESSTRQLPAAKACYEQVADHMADLVAGLSDIEVEQAVTDVQPVIESAQRAGSAALTVVENLTVVVNQASLQPEAAYAALAVAETLDPANPVFEEIKTSLDSFSQLLTGLGKYLPTASGSDLAGWLEESDRALAPYVEEIADPHIAVLVKGVKSAARHWNVFQESTVAGNRQHAVGALQAAAEAIHPLDAGLSAWLNNVMMVVMKARFVQRHALNTSFGRVMAEGWGAWDRGSGIEAERLGKQALEEVRSDAEEAAAERLIRLGKLLRSWKEQNGEGNPELTQQIDTALLSLFTDEEDRYWQDFTERMPSAPAYLKEMRAHLVEHFAATSTAAQRVLFFHYILRGVLEMYESNPDDAEFWRAAAEQTLPEAKQHVAYMSLTNVIRDRQILLQLATQIDSIQSPNELKKVRNAVERSNMQLLMKPFIAMLHQIDIALPEWERGNFRASGEALELAVSHLTEGENQARIQLPGIREWMDRLYGVAAELSVTRQRIADVVNDQQELPDPRLVDWHQKLIDETELHLGAKYTRTFAVWQSNFARMLDVYRDPEKRRSRKLREFDGQLNTAGIDTHPAYELFRFWRGIIESRPEFPAPPTDEPVPRYAEAVEGADSSRDQSNRRLQLPRRTMLLVVMLFIVVLAAVLAASLLNGNVVAPQIDVTWETFTPTVGPNELAVETERVEEVTRTVAATETEELIPSDTPSPTARPTDTVVPSLDPGQEFLPTAAIYVATNTPEPTIQPTLTPSPVPTDTLMPTMASTLQEMGAVVLTEPLRGRQNVLLALERYVDAYPWPETWFWPGDLSGSWLLGEVEAGVGDSLLKVVLPANLLEQIFGENASTRLRRLEATLTLRDYDESLLDDGLVYFGIGLQGADESRVAIQVQLVRQDAINIGARVGEEFRARTTLPINDAQVVLALERYDDGNVALFLGDTPIGPQRFLTAPNAPVIPFLFVQQGGVVVAVTDVVAVLD